MFSRRMPTAHLLHGNALAMQRVRVDRKNNDYKMTNFDIIQPAGVGKYLNFTGRRSNPFFLELV